MTTENEKIGQRSLLRDFNFDASVGDEFEELSKCAGRMLHAGPQVEAPERDGLPDHLPDRLGRKGIVLACSNSVDDPSSERTE